MTRYCRSLALLSLCSMFFASAAAFGQGVLIVTDGDTVVRLPRPVIIHPRRPAPPPTPPVSYAIKAVDVEGKIRNQTANIQVSQTFVNTGSRQMQVSFVFPLPKDAVVDQLTFMVDGREISGQLLAADKARSIYEGHVRRNQDPALLEWVDWGMFKTSVFPVPAGASRKVTLHYSQLLRKSNRLTDFLFPLATAKYTSKPVEKLNIKLSIDSDVKIKSIYSPSHDVKIKRSGNKSATVSFKAEDVTPSNDFRLLFDTADKKLGASVVSYRPNKKEDGYFLLLASPDFKSRQDEKPAAKTVVFVVDRSGSMSGAKIEQAKEALKFVLNNLNKGDTFNIIAYDSKVESFRPELQRFDSDTREQATGFVEGIYAGGSTNIDGALKSALNMLKDNKRPSYVLFLTDGKPTVGERNELKIAQNASEANDVRARVIALGVGFDVNSRLIDRLTRENYGQSEYVRPDQDIEEHVSRVYGRISSPVLTNVTVDFDLEETASEGRSVNRLYPSGKFDVFQGDQVVIVGRYRQSGNAKIRIKGKLGDETKKYDFPGKLAKHSNDQSFEFVEKLWAMRRVGEIIDEIDLNGKNQELVDELMALATKHGILTPYTSFLADETQSHRLAGIESKRQLTTNLDALGLSTGVDGFAQRNYKQRLKMARGVELAQSESVPRYGIQPAADASLGGAAGGPGAPAAPATGGGFGGGGRAANQSRAGAAPGQAGPGQAGPGQAAQGYALTRRRARADNPAAVAELSKRLESNVRRVGSSTMYRRGEKLWIAENIREFDIEKEKSKIKEIKRFTKEYFALVKQNTRAENALLAQQRDDEELIVQLRGQVYRIK